MKDKFSLKKLLVLIGALVPGVIFLCIPRILNAYPAISEQYMREIFPVISAPGVFLVSLLPFSLTEIVIILILVMSIVFLVITILQWRRSKDRNSFVFKRVLVAFLVFSLSSAAYTLMHGIGYTRNPLKNTIGLSAAERSPEELYEVTNWLLEKANETRQELREDEQGCMILSTDLNESLQAGSAAMDKAANVFPVLRGNYVTAKPVFLSHAWSYTGITGMYMPFLLEANVNIDAPDLFLPWTICHETSHVRGIAREEDANLAGFLACVSSDRSDFQYSAYQYALIYCLNDLYYADRSLHKEITDKIADAIWRDWDANSRYWDGFKGPVEETSETINDTFLKANQQEQGVRSYDEVTGLIIEYYFTYVQGVEHAESNS